LLDGCGAGIDDLEKRIKDLEDGKVGADDLFDKVSGAIDDSDKYKVETLNKIRKMIDTLGDDVQGERGGKEASVHDIETLKGEMDKVNPDDISVEMVNAWEKAAQ